MKLSRKTKSFLERCRDIASVFGAVFTTVSVLTNDRVELFEIVLQSISTVLEPFFPGIPANYQIINMIAWIAIIVLAATLVFGIFRLFRWGLDKLTTQFVISLLKDLDDALSEKIEKAIDKKINQKLKEMQPPTPPHGITYTQCPKSGLYRVQEDVDIEATFDRGEVFPTVYINGVERKATWVYQFPKQ